MNITEVCVRRPVLAWMIMAATIVFGLVAARRIGVSQYPDVDYPNITVSMSWSGASPEEVEHGIVEPLEQALAQVEGIQTISSKSTFGSARITAQFDMSRNIDLALQDVQAKVSQTQRRLPKEVDSPTVSKSNPDDQPILTVGLSGPFSRQLLADVARYQVQQRLQTIAGVGQVSLGGYRDRNVRIWLDALKLDETGVTVSEVIQSLQREHVVVPGGQLQTDGREVAVRVLGEAIDLETLRNFVVKRVGAGAIKLRQVALVEDGFEDERTIARFEGAPVQSMSILKQRGANAVAVAADVRRVLDEIKSTLPEGMDLTVLFDTTTFIEEAVHEIELELLLAVILTGSVCWLFLGSLSSTFNVLLAIPMSLLGTVGVIYFLGFTFNTFTLLGLSLAVGLVVDDAVMVMENIYRHAEMGKDRVKASLEGTGEITFAALAATVAVIAIFLPVVFMEGVVGKFFLQFGVTLSVSVGFSYIEAVTMAPSRCAQILDVSHQKNWLMRAVDWAFSKLERGYSAVLTRGLRYPWLVLLAAALLMGASVKTATGLRQEFSPPQDQSRLGVRITAQVGSDLRETERLVGKVEAALRARPEVQSILTNINVGSGNLSVTLVPPAQRKMTQQQLVAALRSQLSSIPGAKVNVQDLSQQNIAGGRGGSPIEFSVRGPEWGKLIAISQQMRDKLTESGLATDVDTDYQVGLPEVQVTPDRGAAAALGVTVQEVASTINYLVGGAIIGKYSADGRRVDVKVRLLADQRERPEDIEHIRVRTPAGARVPLSVLVKQDERPVLQAISHVDRERAISITGNLGPGKSQADVIALVQSLGKDLPVGYRVVLGGQSVQFAQSTGGLVFALLLGILVAYMVLAAQFNSFAHPVTVLSILPLSLAGAAFGLSAGDHSLNMFSMIGVLLLMGIVKKNSIILVDYAAEVEAREGADATTAMSKAGPVRLRPILMTTIATSMAAVPAVLGLGPGAETRAPMASAVLGGLAVSTLLSLVVVPAFYIIVDRVRRRFSKPREAAPAPVVDGGGA